MATPRHTDARSNPSLRKEMTPQQIAEMFDDFADDYEKVMLERGIRSHEIVGDYLAKAYPEGERSNVKVLDVAAGTGPVGVVVSTYTLPSSVHIAGTGPVGVLLKKLGFSTVDALDPAQKMLDKAKAKNIYRKLICAFMDENRIDEIETDYYDCITATGGFNEGLIPCKAFPQMIRIVKPGGRIVFTIPNKNIVNADEYRDRLLPLISKMEDEGVWNVTSIPLADGELSHNIGPGTLFSLQVNVSEKYFHF